MLQGCLRWPCQAAWWRRGMVARCCWQLLCSPCKASMWRSGCDGHLAGSEHNWQELAHKSLGLTGPTACCSRHHQAVQGAHVICH